MHRCFFLRQTDMPREYTAKQLDKASFAELKDIVKRCGWDASSGDGSIPLSGMSVPMNGHALAFTCFVAFAFSYTVCLPPCRHFPPTSGKGRTLAVIREEVKDALGLCSSNGYDSEDDADRVPTTPLRPSAVAHRYDVRQIGSQIWAALGGAAAFCPLHVCGQTKTCCRFASLDCTATPSLVGYPAPKICRLGDSPGAQS